MKVNIHVVFRRDNLEGEKRTQAANEKKKKAEMERETRDLKTRLAQYEETTKNAERGQDAPNGRHD